MASFEDLGLRPELVEALAAEGIETPTALQHEAIPVLRKGNAALLRGGPGAGVLVAWSAPLLDRLDPVPGGPVVVALVATDQLALDVSRSLGRLAAAAGHRVAALGGPFALPGHADVLVATPAVLAAAVSATEVSLDGVQAVVLVGGGALLDDAAGVKATGDLLGRLDAEAVQVIVVADPVTPAVRSFVDAHLSKAVFLPSDAGSVGDTGTAPIQRGTLRVRTLEGDETLELPRLVGNLLEEGSHHLLLFFRSEDRAADLGDLLTLHGFTAGGPGDPEVPIWLATHGMDARRAMADAPQGGGSVSVLSVDAPSDADELDRRHGGGNGDGVILARAREMAHLRRITREAGYAINHFPVPPDDESPATRFAQALAETLEGEDLDPYHLLVAEAVERWGATQVAAALALLLRRGGRVPGAAAGTAAAPGVPSAFVRLFLSVGSVDGIGPGELLGAITGETGLKGERVGRIDVRDTFSRVEVDEAVAADIIKAMNGISIRGRSVRADYDRQAGRGAASEGPPPSGGSRGGAPSRGGQGGAGRGGPARGGSGTGRSGPARSGPGGGAGRGKPPSRG
jgi:ATP-dependent RNA helicase DeaD